jgi:hypothetical protein
MMSKEIKDYLHLYFGCPLSRGGNLDAHMYLYSNLKQMETGENKMILRPLSSINYAEMLAMAEADAYYKYSSWDDAVQTMKNIIKGEEFRPQTTAFLLSRHFDLFGLIEAGLAIDSNTIK